MTLALCLFCGSFKFGALVPCPTCGSGPTGLLEADITFTDHFFSADILKALSANLRILHSAAKSPELTVWSFLGFVARHNATFRATPPDHLRPQVEALLETLNLPPVYLPGQPSTPSPSSWLRATWLGWLLGIPFIAALALIAELAHLGGLQVFVGAGMGLGVGLLQSRLLRRLAVPAKSWVLASAVGLALPFLAWDIAQGLGASWPYYLAGCVTVGGATVGAWQAFLLRQCLNGPGWWIAGSLIGWGLAGALASSGDILIKGQALHGLSGAAIYLALVTLPGGVLGWVTARVLAARWRAASG